MTIFYPPFQERVFISFFIIGVFLGIVFDAFKIKRRIFGKSGLVVFIDDVVFSLICSVILPLSVFVFNNGIVRWFEFFMCLFGFLVYRLTASRIVIKIAYFLVDVILKILLTLIRPIADFTKSVAYPIYLFTERKKQAAIVYGFINNLNPIRK